MNPEIIEPGESATITMNTFNGTNPLGWVQVRLTTSTGSLSKLESRSDESGPGPSSRTSVLIGSTDLNGEYRCRYTAPSADKFTSVRVDIEASGAGMITNTSSVDIIVNPHKQLEVGLKPTKSSYFMGEPITISVNVTAGGNAVDSALVKYSIEYDSQTLSDFGIADFHGIYELVHTAPVVAVETDLLIKLNVTKPGYLAAEDSITVKVLPQAAYEFDIEVTIKNALVEAGTTTELTVTVRNGTGGAPVSGASLLMSIEHGTLETHNGVTGSDGKFKVKYTAPPTVSVITVSVFKAKVSNMDFNDRTVSYNITITPEGEGGNGEDDGEQQGLLSSPLFYVSLIIIVIVIIIAIMVLMQAKKKRTAMEATAGEERVDEKKDRTAPPAKNQS